MARELKTSIGQLGDMFPGSPVERYRTCIAVNRNNRVFFGSDQGGRTAAVLRSL